MSVIAATSVIFLTGQMGSRAPEPLVLQNVPPDLLAPDAAPAATKPADKPADKPGDVSPAEPKSGMN